MRHQILPAAWPKRTWRMAWIPPFLAVLLVVGLFPLASSAQQGGQCTRFGEGDQAGWAACPTRPQITVGVSNGSDGYANSTGDASDYFLLLKDLSGASAACNTTPAVTGNWVEKFGQCGQFCFDFKLFYAGSPPAPVPPRFSIFSGSLQANFVANFTVTPQDDWVHVCAPIKTIDPGDNLPSGSDGEWRISGSNGYDANWNSIITNVTKVLLPIDFTSQPSEVAGYDNFCFLADNCQQPPEPPKACLQLEAKPSCDAQGNISVTLSGTGPSGFAADQLEVSCLTPGVTVSPSTVSPVLPWQSFALDGATPGQTVTLMTNAVSGGKGDVPGSDLCCGGTIKVDIPKDICDRPNVDIGITKRLVRKDPVGVISGYSLLYAIEVTNEGGMIPASSTVGVTDSVPAGMTITGISAGSGWDCSSNTFPVTGPATVQCSYQASANIPPGATIGTLMVAATVQGDGLYLNCANADLLLPNGTTDGALDNNRDCEKLVIGTPGGMTELHVVKKVVGQVVAVLPPDVAFPVSIDCGTAATTLVLDGGNGFAGVLQNIPLGNNCTVTEQPPLNGPALPTTCHWQTSYDPAQTVQATFPPATVTVTNEVVCKTPGTLTIRKIVDIPDMVIDPNVNSVNVDVSCSDGLTETVTLNRQNGGVQTLADQIPEGSTCDISEQPVQAPSGCQWDTSYSPGQQVTISGATEVTITNRLACQGHKPTADNSTTYDLKITKTGPKTCTAGGTCRFNVNVTNLGPGPFDGPLVVDDVTNLQGMVALSESSGGNGWSCTQAGTAIICSNPALHLSSGQSSMFRINFRMSGRIRNGSRFRECVQPGSVSQLPQGRAQVRQVQAALNTLGYDAGPVDGVAGRRTQRAIATYSADHGLPSGRSISPAFLEALFGTRGTDTNPGNDRGCADVAVRRVTKPQPSRKPPKSTPSKPSAPKRPKCTLPYVYNPITGGCVSVIQVVPQGSGGAVKGGGVARP